MKKASAIFLFALFTIGALPAAFAQDTTVRVGRVGYGPADLPDFSSVSTAQIDPVLYLVHPSRFGQHYTRDIANRVITDVTDMNSRIQTQLAPIFAQIPRALGTPTVTVGSNPLYLDVWQTDAGVRAQLFGLSLAANLNIDANIWGFCSTAHVTFKLNSIAVTSEYSIASGQLQNSRVDYVLGNVGVSCTGILSPITNLLLDTFVNGPIRDAVKRELAAIVQSEMSMLDTRSIFSAHDFLEGLRYYGSYGYLNALANQAINTAQDIVANPWQLNRSVRLSLVISRAPSGNVVDFFVSHVEHGTPEIIDYPGTNNTRIEFGMLPNTGRIDAFYRYPAGSGPWYFLGSTTTGVLSFAGSYPIGTEIAGIAVNRHHPHLRSYVADTLLVEHSPICTRLCTPEEPE